MPESTSHMFRQLVDEVEREPAPVIERGDPQPVFNAMTIDVEDYFHVTNFESTIDPSQWDSLPGTVDEGTDRILAAMDDAEVTGTFFVLGWVAEKNPAVVKRIADAGHEIASHGFWHKRVFEHTPDHFRQDVRRSKALLEDITGTEVLGHRAPTFSIDEESLWALDILLEEGFEYDSSLFPGRIYRPGFAPGFRQPHNIDRGEHGLIKEIPMTSLRLLGVRVPFAGGGYFRLYPYPLIRWGMSRINRVEGVPVIVYIHPWELVPGQPRVKDAPAIRRFKHYVNLDTFESKIVRLMRDFRFKSCRDILDDYRL